MKDRRVLSYIKEILEHIPADWLRLTTHRLDIYHEERAKVEFLEEFERLFRNNQVEASALRALPTAFDYIRLGHPLSSILEWTIARLNNRAPKSVISFSSNSIALLAILRKNQLENKKTLINYFGVLPDHFDEQVLREIYGYNFELRNINTVDEISDFKGSSVLFTQHEDIAEFTFKGNIDFYIHTHPKWGSVVLIDGENQDDYISEIQHVRRRETIAMTPADALDALKYIANNTVSENSVINNEENKKQVLNLIQELAGVNTHPLIGSSGLSIQYAIMMGLVDDAAQKHKGKSIKFIVPNNCYGGTNDQARRVAACIDQVDVVDLAVDGDHDMVKSLDLVLKEVAAEDAIPYIIAEIPTNPRVEVPDLNELKRILSKERRTQDGIKAIDPVFILDQTFCPNVHFLGEGRVLSTIRAISYASGSKFPSGGLCTAGYCVGNEKTEPLMSRIEAHLKLCNNEATDLQVQILAHQLPSMNQRIDAAYHNTRDFVNFIQEELPEAKINFVSETLAEQGFTPSVFSLDLPTRGDTHEERETYKRALNLKLIHLMISEIPHESKFCVSYGQLKGCYWTIPATSTQGTTKEGDKDYIVRVALSANMDMQRHKEVFTQFIEKIEAFQHA